jgi:hypothetical protein
MKSTSICNIDEGASLETPERNLWFAVIERALKDYCFFFDKLRSNHQGNLIHYESLSPKSRTDFNSRAIGEHNRLRWFFFSTEMQPFNLQYLAEQLYEDSEGNANRIRKEASEQFKRNYLEATEIGRFAAITSYIKENTNIESVIAADTDSHLKYKRFRLGG